MRKPAGDRRRPALAALCTAVLLVVLPAAASTAEYRILPDGTAFNASVELTDAERYEFFETGVLGERVPLVVRDVVLSGACNPCEFTWDRDSVITFPRGNYTLSFQGPVRQNHFMAAFESARHVTVILPEGLDVRNPALGMISAGGVVTARDDGSVTVTWNATRVAEVRFYDRGREDLLYIFANFWVVIAIVLLVPFLLTWKKTGK